MRERLVFYDASLVAGQIGEGGDYETLKRVISILITNYELIPKSQSPLYHHRFTLYDPRAAVELTNLLEVRTLELPKIPETPDVYLCNWLRFFRAETKEELDMVANASPAIAKATARVLKLSKDERARLIHEYEVKAQRDERARTNYAVTTAVTTAVNESLTTVALNMLEMNMSPADISKATGLNHEEIEKLTH